MTYIQQNITRFFAGVVLVSLVFFGVQTVVAQTPADDPAQEEAANMDVAADEPFLTEVEYEFTAPDVFTDEQVGNITPQVIINGDDAAISCRGYVRCSPEIGDSCDLQMAWTPIWPSPAVDANGNSYEEMLTISFGGTIAPQWPYYVDGALVIDIETSPNKKVKVWNRCGNHALMAQADLPNAIQTLQTHNVRVSLETNAQNRKILKIYVTPAGQEEGAPILTVDVTDVECLDNEDQIMISNREGVAGVHHCSVLSDINIR